MAEFTKIEGTGNDFILFEASSLPTILPEKIPQICNRNFGIGADGLIILHRKSNNLVSLDFYNSDSLPASMCGNALRAIGAYLYKKNDLEESTVELGGRAHRVGKHQEGFFAEFPIVESISGPIQNLDSRVSEIYFLHTGTEHLVIECHDLENLDVVGIGKTLRYHKEFAPRGTNVNFVKFLTDDSLEIRTYERGVEDETLSCGSGTVAAAVVGRYLGKLKEPLITIKNRSPFPAWVNVPGYSLPFNGIELIGPANVVFTGAIDI